MTADSLSLRDVRRMLEGVVPPAMCTASADGVPHVNYLSQAEYVDDAHVALSFQFFNRSRANVLATGRAACRAGVSCPPCRRAATSPRARGYCRIGRGRAPTWPLCWIPPWRAWAPA